MSLGVAVFIGVIILGCAIAYGIIQSRSRNRANEAARNDAIRDQYRENGSASGLPPR